MRGFRGAFFNKNAVEYFLYMDVDEILTPIKFEKSLIIFVSLSEISKLETEFHHQYEMALKQS